MIKTNTILALFVALIIILAINPKSFYDSYNTNIGKIIILCIVVFFAFHNTTLGLLVVLALVVISNEHSTFIEGMTTIGDDNVATSNPGDKIIVTTEPIKPSLTMMDDSSTISQLKTMNSSIGANMPDIETNIRSQQSNSIPVNPNSKKSSEDVMAASSSMMTNKSTLTEGFASSASRF